MVKHRVEDIDAEYEQREPRWKFDRNINLGNLGAILTFAATVFVWGSHTETRVAVLESHTIEQDQSLIRIAQENKELTSEIKAALLRLEVAVTTRSEANRSRIESLERRVK